MKIYYDENEKEVWKLVPMAKRLFDCYFEENSQEEITGYVKRNQRILCF